MQVKHGHINHYQINCSYLQNYSAKSRTISDGNSIVTQDDQYAPNLNKAIQCPGQKFLSDSWDGNKVRNPLLTWASQTNNLGGTITKEIDIREEVRYPIKRSQNCDQVH